MYKILFFVLLLLHLLVPFAISVDVVAAVSVISVACNNALVAIVAIIALCLNGERESKVKPHKIVGFSQPLGTSGTCLLRR